MQRRIRPIHGPRDVSMFHRSDVDVIDVALQVVFVAYQMLPIPPLPDPAFAFGGASCAAMLSRGSVVQRPPLYMAPEHGVSGLAGRHLSHATGMSPWIVRVCRL